MAGNKKFELTCSSDWSVDSKRWNEFHTSKSKKMLWNSNTQTGHADVNIPGISQYFQTLPGLNLQVNKSHHLNLLISSSGCCACCAVVAVICVCLLVYQDYAATSTGIGNQQILQNNSLFSHDLFFSNSFGPNHRIKVQKVFKSLKMRGFVLYCSENRVY